MKPPVIPATIVDPPSAAIAGIPALAEHMTLDAGSTTDTDYEPQRHSEEPDSTFYKRIGVVPHPRYYVALTGVDASKPGWNDYDDSKRRRCQRVARIAKLIVEFCAREMRNETSSELRTTVRVYLANLSAVHGPVELSVLAGTELSI